MSTRREQLIICRFRSIGLRPLAGLAELEAQLRQVNGDLWTIEDRIRDCERQGDSGPAY